MMDLVVAYGVTTVFLMVPLIISASLHMVIVRLDWFAALRLPIHRRWFGANKTVRGLVAMPVLTIGGVAVAQALEPLVAGRLLVSVRDVSALALGTAVGLGYVVAELPNSFMKRRLGIPPGQRPRRHAAWFAAMDHADVALGCTLVFAVAFPGYPALIVLLLVFGPVVHLAANVVLYQCGVRRGPF